MGKTWQGNENAAAACNNMEKHQNIISNNKSSRKYTQNDYIYIKPKRLKYLTKYCLKRQTYVAKLWLKQGNNKHKIRNSTYRWEGEKGS